MALIDDRTRETLRERFESLDQPVQLTLHRRPGSGRLILPGGLGCQTCEQAQELAEALVEASAGRVTLEVVDHGHQAEAGEEVPLIMVGRPGEEARIRFQGLPAGYEFATLVDAVERVSAAEPGLSVDSLSRIAELDHEVEVMVFVTPSCPYCPGAASLAGRLALASPRVNARVVEANEFPELSRRHQVQGVPRTVVNGGGAFVGALPEEAFVSAVLELAGAGVES